MTNKPTKLFSTALAITLGSSVLTGCSLFSSDEPEDVNTTSVFQSEKQEKNEKDKPAQDDKQKNRDKKKDRENNKDKSDSNKTSQDSSSGGSRNGERNQNSGSSQSSPSRSSSFGVTAPRPSGQSFGTPTQQTTRPPVREVVENVTPHGSRPAQKPSTPERETLTPPAVVAPIPIVPPSATPGSTIINTGGTGGIGGGSSVELPKPIPQPAPNPRPVVPAPTPQPEPKPTPLPPPVVEVDVLDQLLKDLGKAKEEEKKALRAVVLAQAELRGANSDLTKTRESHAENQKDLAEAQAKVEQLEHELLHNVDSQIMLALENAKSEVERTQSELARSQSDLQARQAAHQKARTDAEQALHDFTQAEHAFNNVQVGEFDTSSMTDGELDYVVSVFVVSMINEYRVNAGLNPLAVYNGGTQDTRSLVESVASSSPSGVVPQNVKRPDGAGYTSEVTFGFHDTTVNIADTVKNASTLLKEWKNGSAERFELLDNTHRAVSLSIKWNGESQTYYGVARFYQKSHVEASGGGVFFYHDMNELQNQFGQYNESEARHMAEAVEYNGSQRVVSEGEPVFDSDVHDRRFMVVGPDMSEYSNKWAERDRAEKVAQEKEAEQSRVAETIPASELAVERARENLTGAKAQKEEAEVAYGEAVDANIEARSDEVIALSLEKSDAEDRVESTSQKIIELEEKIPALEDKVASAEKAYDEAVDKRESIEEEILSHSAVGKSLPRDAANTTVLGQP